MAETFGDGPVALGAVVRLGGLVGLKKTHLVVAEEAGVVHAGQPKKAHATSSSATTIAAATNT